MLSYINKNRLKIIVFLDKRGIECINNIVCLNPLEQKLVF